jgi:DNA-binding response OmpR family regulator
LSREEILERVWGPSYKDASMVKLYVGYLRAKIERNPATPELIHNQRGIGYCYQKPS